MVLPQVRVKESRIAALEEACSEQQVFDFSLSFPIVCPIFVTDEILTSSLLTRMLPHQTCARQISPNEAISENFRSAITHLAE